MDWVGIVERREGVPRPVILPRTCSMLHPEPLGAGPPPPLPLGKGQRRPGWPLATR